MDEEMEMVDLAFETQIIQKCKHEIKTEYFDRLTQDGREYRLRVMSCPKCGKRMEKVVWEEKVSSEIVKSC